MTPECGDSWIEERFERLRTIVLAVAVVPEGQRAIHLEVLCGGDDRLRREAESLLAHDQEKLSAVPQDELMKALTIHGVGGGSPTSLDPDSQT